MDGFPTIPVQKSVETMARFERGKNLKTTNGFPTIPEQKSVEAMARFVRGKKFETPDGFPIIPVQKKCGNYGNIWQKKKV